MVGHFAAIPEQQGYRFPRGPEAAIVGYNKADGKPLWPTGNPKLADQRPALAWNQREPALYARLTGTLNLGSMHRV